jgi:hypothetical protein
LSRRTHRAVDLAIIFGAGASIPPLISQEELVRKLVQAPAEDRIRAAQKYLRRTFPGLAENKDTIRFEDIVGPLEIAESEEYWYHFGGRRSGTSIPVTNKEVLDSLDSWVAMTLDPDDIPKPTKDREGKAFERFGEFYSPHKTAPLAYARMVDRLKEADQLNKTVFVSMNYDVLLDRVLYSSRTHEPDYSIDAFYDEPSSPSGLAQVPLLKLHGSLNWLVCDQCHVLRNLRNFVVWPNSNCPGCRMKTARPMLIRPTLLKDFRHRVWRDVWQEAGHVLASARQWIFIGYSLPMADVWILRLLAQSARSGGIKPRERFVTVVNPDPDSRRRFALLFPKANFEVRVFEEWLNKWQPLATAGKKGQKSGGDLPVNPLLLE